MKIFKISLRRAEILLERTNLLYKNVKQNGSLNNFVIPICTELQAETPQREKFYFLKRRAVSPRDFIARQDATAQKISRNAVNCFAFEDFIYEIASFADEF